MFEAVTPRSRSAEDLSVAFAQAYRPLRRLYLALTAAGAIAVVVLALILPVPGLAFLGILMLASVLGGLPAAGIFLVLLRRCRLRPAGEVHGWWWAGVLQDWLDIDGGKPPETTEEGLTRLGDRSDELAIRWRTALLVAAHLWHEARTSLDGWDARDPLAVARIAAVRSSLAFDESGIDDLAEADAAARVIPDHTDRRAQLVRLAVERAQRACVRGGDPIGILADARPLLTSAEVKAARRLLRPSRPVTRDPKRLLSWLLIAGLAIWLALELITLAR